VEVQTAKLDEILRQKDPTLRETVEQLARGDVRGIANLERQGRVHEIVNPLERFGAIAREYSRHPEGTLVISPDNKSRRELNSLIHREMQNRGDVSKDEHKVRVLESRQEMTGADRQWAGQYQVGDVVRYSRGSEALKIDAGVRACPSCGREGKPYNDRARERNTAELRSATALRSVCT
jgi:hypothetical protein